ncbi:hypothetical protein ABZX88_34480 [Kitasatospora aureofaciens]|uniref:hypothetical protein n=1 Tax=Kitasatospora aureofaciens TaxID=1894 RepID=UPI0033B9BD47
MTATNPYENAPDLHAEAADLVALEHELHAGPRVPRTMRPLALRKAAWLDRAALADPDNPRTAAEAEKAAEQLRAHDHVFGGRLGHLPPRAVDWTGNPRGYVRQEWVEHAAGRCCPRPICPHEECAWDECNHGEGYWDRPANQDPAITHSIVLVPAGVTAPTDTSADSVERDTVAQVSGVYRLTVTQDEGAAVAEQAHTQS